MNSNVISDSTSIFVQSMETLWSKIAAFLPNLVVGILVLIIGLVVATTLSAVVRRIVQQFKVDSWAASSDTMSKLRGAGVNVTPSAALAWLVKWFFILVFLIAVAGIWNLYAVSSFLDTVILYIPNVIAALLILILGVLASEAIRRVVEVSVKASKIIPGEGMFLAGVARWAIVAFAGLAALSQLQIADELIQTLVAGLVFGLALALGLAFGLGSVDRVKRFWSESDRN